MGLPHERAVGPADRRLSGHHGRRSCRDHPVLRTTPLMHELERRARALGLSSPELARRIGMERTGLAHIRSGRDRISLGALHRIALWFPNDEAIRRLVWSYILHDVETARERLLRERTLSEDADGYAGRLTESSVALLRSFVADFPARVVSGTGLLIVSADASALSASLGFVEAELRARRIHSIRQAASSRIAASAVSALVACPVLLVERVEYASASMAAVLKGRAAYLKLTVATCVADGQGTAAAGSPILQLLGRTTSRVSVDSAAAAPSA